MGLKPGGYVLIVPGGGTGHPGVQDAAQQFLFAANSLADTETVVFVGPAKNAGSTSALNPRLRQVDSLPQGQLAQLLAEARLVVTNGGSTLLQAIACARACVAVPIAKDQAGRIAFCVQAGVALGAELTAAGIERAAEKLLRDEPARAALAQRASRLKLANGVEIALNALKHLAETA
jgi:UDP:flavonoid glycosyltransferase YjiC (YdhE family)